MIPILYEKTESNFKSNGLGRLSDCIRCLASEERNGIYEVEFEYPVTGVHFEDIQMGRIIACTHDEQGDVQPFDIYAKSEPINGIVTFYAHHISYRLNEITVKPFTAGSCADAISKIKTKSVKANPFTFWTNKSVAASYISETPRKARTMLGGEENSILDVFGTGEYEFDKFDVKLHLHRGQDTNVSIRYGKNLVDFDNNEDASDTYTAVVPFWLGSETEGDESVSVLVTLPEWYLTSGHSVPSGREVIVPMDLSGDFDEKPTVAQLRTAAQNRLASSDGWLPSQTITIDFVQLWQTEEYKDYAPLQRLRLCDTCGVFVPMYGMSLRAKVIKVVYNVLLDRYDSMELGDKPTTFSAVLEKQFNSKVAGIEQGFQAIKIDIQTVEQNAAADATQKANAAQSAAESTASADATAKANAAETAAKGYADTQIASAKSTIESEYEQAVEDATELIRGGTGGYIVTTVNANGQPIELLITDNLNLNQAVNIWRWNLGGLAHSSNGYNGPFNDVAITQDGKINASMIMTGILNANLIRAGTITDETGDNYWDLESGEFSTTKGKIASWTIDENDLIYAPYNYRRTTLNGRNGFTSFYCQQYKEDFFNRYYLSKGIRVGNAYDGARIEFRGGKTTSPQSSLPDKLFELGIREYYSNDVLLTLCILNANGRSIMEWEQDRFECFPAAYFRGNLTVFGTKSRNVKTPNYSDRLLYCYETPTPLFGDIGEATIDEDGFAYVDIDDIFSETVASRVEYQVFLQAEGEGTCYIAEKHPNYFVIKGTPNLKVAWELKAKQRDYENIRLEQSDNGLEEYGSETVTINDIDSYINEQEALLYG